MLGVGYHHAGVDMSDRKLVEQAFTQGDLPVLCEILLTVVLSAVKGYAPTDACKMVCVCISFIKLLA